MPVLHALELVVTWLPSASRPETRAETPLAITCSTAVLPRRRTFFCVDVGHHPRGDRVHAADAGAEHGAGVPIDAVVAALGTREAGVEPGLERGERDEAVARVHREQLVFGEGRRRQLVDALRHAGDLAAEAGVAHLRVRAQAGTALAQRELEIPLPVGIGSDHAEAGDDDARAHRGTPMPEIVPAHTMLPSSRRISTWLRSLLRRK